MDELINKLIVTMIKPRKGYAAIVWFKHKKSIRKVERIKRTATKMVTSLRNLTYEIE